MKPTAKIEVMVQQLKPTTANITFPDSDGQPMADNTLQFQWIVVIKENLEILFADDADVFVAGDLLWYPVADNNKIRRAPDAMVVFGRPKGYRGSYIQSKEENIPPQVVFEILSPSNTLRAMAEKLAFYQTYGVEEYYLYNPYTMDLCGWQTSDDQLTVIPEMEEWVSPRLGIRFESKLGESLKIWMPDGRPFLTPVELERQRQAAIKAQQKAETRADQAETRADQAETRVEQLAAKLRELGIDPSAL